jgi:hypothetical protein
MTRGIPPNERRNWHVMNLKVLAARMQSRVDYCVEKAESKEAAVTGSGVGIGYLFACDLARGMADAAAFLDGEIEP